MWVYLQLKAQLGISEFINKFTFLRNEYGDYVSIITKTETLERNSKKAKVIVTLKRHAKYFDNMKLFEEIMKENQEKEKEGLETKK